MLTTLVTPPALKWRFAVGARRTPLALDSVAQQH
jgi:hypothetical protein